MDRMLRWFDYAHLPQRQQQVSAAFQALAQVICTELNPGPERTVALRKLLESKDAAVRSSFEGEPSKYEPEPDD